jgi:hypothetical protein
LHRRPRHTATEIGNDSVVSALEAIINKFGAELVPHAALLVQKLCESFLQYAQADDDDDAAMAACQCVDAVIKLTDSVCSQCHRRAMASCLFSTLIIVNTGLLCRFRTTVGSIVYLLFVT